MKVLFATCTAWLLHKVGNAIYRSGYRLEVWGCQVEEWAGLHNWDDYKAGGTD